MTNMKIIRKMLRSILMFLFYTILLVIGAANLFDGGRIDLAAGFIIIMSSMIALMCVLQWVFDYQGKFGAFKEWDYD